MKRTIAILAALLAVLMMFVGCGKTKILHCDHCNKEVTVEESSNMEEEWIIYCPECNEELFGDDPVVGDGSTS